MKTTMVHMRTFFLAVALMAGCDNAWGPGSAISTTCDDPRWDAQVQSAVDTWNLTLPDCGVLLVLVERGGHPVELYDGHDWDDSIGGRFDGDTVRVRKNLGSWEFAVLMHELGHALGLEHVPESVDEYSLMNPSVGSTEGQLSQGDIVRARKEFGCE